MSKVAFYIAFLLGSVAVAWMAWIFSGAQALAFIVTGVIGLVYVAGFVELLRFRRDTDTLTRALENIPNNLVSLAPWLRTVAPSLRDAVLMRIEGQRGSLPVPVLTPYLAGLLVMLGLLGTFLGMVETLKGAVIALEGTADLAAIRAGLVAPMNGLGFAFGTSVAGVAASAMLGLMLTLTRRDRVAAIRLLDTKIATTLRAFSFIHRRESTDEAMQVQAQALPALTQHLQGMTEQLEQMMGALGDTLTHNQERFHADTTRNYENLAASVSESLRSALADSGRLAAENIKPIVETVMQGLRSETQTAQESQAAAIQKQFDRLARDFAESTQAISATWQATASSQAQSSDQLINVVQEAQSMYSNQLDEISATLLSSFENVTTELAEQQAAQDQQRLGAWVSALSESQVAMTDQLSSAAASLTQTLTEVTGEQRAAVEAVVAQFEQATESIVTQLQEAAARASAQQRDSVASFDKTASGVIAHQKETAEALVLEMGRALGATEALIEARVASESAWVTEYQARMEQLIEVLQCQFEALREAEDQRGGAAVARLGDLEAAVTTHLSRLGQSLEAPMTRLIETASETPRAAAEVIEQLRKEMSKNIAHDNTQLEERRKLMEELTALTTSLAGAASDQRDAVEKLVHAATHTLEAVSTQFSSHLREESTKLSEASELFTGSAIEMSSLGDGFNEAVLLFTETNEKLCDNLKQVEHALADSATRSNEQLAYYVAQAREIIDYSMLSQKDFVTALQSRRQTDEPVSTEVC